MAHTHRSTYRRPELDKQHVLDAWFRKRRQKQARLMAEATERTMRSSTGGFSFA